MPAQTPHIPSNVIWLKLIGHQWYSFLEASEVTLELFGTNQLPTPYSTDTPAEEVVKAIQKLNPEKLVMVTE